MRVDDIGRAERAQQRARARVEQWARQHDPDGHLPVPNGTALLLELARVRGRELDDDEVLAVLADTRDRAAAARASAGGRVRKT
jgi:hypothetical protein